MHENPLIALYMHTSLESNFISGDCFLQLSLSLLQQTAMCILAMMNCQSRESALAARYLFLGAGRCPSSMRCSCLFLQEVNDIWCLPFNSCVLLPTGSRSSPLALAAVSHPQATIIPCIDERSLGFWALGFSRATGLPAPVITSSGTAVANLLPSVVEASMSQMPMLLLTADRPPELRDTGANQAIDQVQFYYVVPSNEIVCSPWRARTF